MGLAEQDARERWRWYEQLAGLPRTAPHLPPDPLSAFGPSEEESS